MQDVERVARILAPHLEGGREFDQMPPDRRTLKIWRANGMCSTNDATQEDAINAATAAISAMTPDTALFHALHAGEDVGYVRGWNAAIDELERQDGFGEWADAAKFLRQLKNDTGNQQDRKD